MTSICDTNVVGLDKGKFSSNLGIAHEFVVAGILMRLGFDVSVAALHGGPYDLVVKAYADGSKSEPVLLRAQVKTAKDNIKFMGGLRAGSDRAYTSKEKKLVDKTYKYTEEHSDLIIGVDAKSMDLYLIPTRIIKHFGRSKSLTKLKMLKNRWELLLNWSESYLKALEKEIVKAS